MKTRLFSYFLATILTVSLRAQTPPVPERPVPPEGPLIQKRAPEFSSWVVSARVLGAAVPTSSGGTPSTTDTQAKPASTVEQGRETPKCIVTKTGKIYHVRLVDSQKQIWDVWADGGLIAIDQSKGETAALVAPPGDRDSINPLYVNFSKSDFEGFDWISAANYQGIKTVMGQECLVFTGDVKVNTRLVQSNGASEIKDVFDTMVACVDKETRLPVSLTNASGVTTYKFLQAPTQMLNLPQSVLSLVQKQHELDKSLARRPGKPY